MLAFFGKSEKVLAPRKKERKRERKSKKVENREYGYWSMVYGRGISRNNEWTIETLVETLNGKMGGGEKKNCKIQKFP